jgi:hypothetical protein
MPGRAKKENENGLVLFWQWVQKAKAKQHKQCAHKKSIFKRGEIMNEELKEKLTCTRCNKVSETYCGIVYSQGDRVCLECKKETQQDDNRAFDNYIMHGR